MTRPIPAHLAATACMLLALGCSTPDAKLNDSGQGGGLEGPWSTVVEEIEGGVVLSAWSDGDTLRFVGGDLGGGHGLMLHLVDGEICLEPGVTERALWWIDGAATGDFYAVGEAGTVLHEVDGVRTREDVPTDATLFGVWVDRDDGTVWVAGGVVGSGKNRGEIWRKESGGGWVAISTELPGVLFKVWNGWFVGQDYVHHWQGGVLEDIEVGERLLTVRGRSADDVWAVGGLTSPTVLHWAGEGWAPADSTGLNQVLNGIWTDEGEDIWVAGNYGTTAHWDGSTWVQPELPLSLEHLHGVHKHGDDVFFMGGNLFSPGSNRGVILRHSEGGAPIDWVDCAG